jgi:hypothetical protein
MEKMCACCKRIFIPRPTVRNQQYCSDSECQKTRKKRWQKEKLANDREYRENQAVAQKEWCSRNKSWVSRRISLLERLSEEVQEDIRLVLVSVSVGRELAKLPRGNQRAAAEAVLKHRLSIREVEKLITHLLCRPRWEHQRLLMAPWEIIEPKQSKPVGFQAQLISMPGICKSVLLPVALEILKQKGKLNRHLTSITFH